VWLLKYYSYIHGNAYRESIIQNKTSFDAIASYIEGNSGKDKVEIWFARDLQPLLGYARWENFQVAINRAVESSKTQGVSIDDHFREVTRPSLCETSSPPHLFRSGRTRLRNSSILLQSPQNIRPTSALSWMLRILSRLLFRVCEKFDGVLDLWVGLEAWAEESSGFVVTGYVPAQHIDDSIGVLEMLLPMTRSHTTGA